MAQWVIIMQDLIARKHSLPQIKKRKKKRKTIFAAGREWLCARREGKLAYLAPSVYLTCLIESRERWMGSYLSHRRTSQATVFMTVCPWLCRGRVCWRWCLFERTKPHTADRNCKMLYAFQFAICLVEEGRRGACFF